MVKEIVNPKTEGQWKKELARIADVLRQKGTKPTPFPTKLETKEDFLKINALNAHKFDPTGYSKEDLPPVPAFKEAGVKYFQKVRGYLYFMIKNAPDKKRKADNEEEKAKRVKSGQRPLDKSLFGDDVEAREAAMKKAAWDADKMEVTMKKDDFRDLGGCQEFWDKLSADQRAAKVEEARVLGQLWRRLRKTRAVKRLDLAAADERTGASPGDNKYPKFGLEEDEDIVKIIVEELRDALKSLGVDWVCEAWQNETCVELKLRGLMDQLSRVLTIGAITTKEHVDQALAALHRALRKALAAWYATLPKARVPALGEATNRGDASSPAACAAAPAGGDADVRVDAATRAAAQTARGGAASALGGDAELPPMDVLLAAAQQHGLALDGFLLEVYEGTLAGEARFADDAPDASAAARGADFLTRRARCVSPNLDNAHAIRDDFNGLPLGDTPFGRLALVLLRLRLVTFDAATGKAVPGEHIRRMRERVAGLPVGEKGRGAQFHIHQVVLVAVQYAFINKHLDFERMQLSLFQCVFGRYLLALWAWLNGLTATDFIKMGLPLDMVVVEADKQELPNLPAWFAKAFPDGVKFEAPAELLSAHQAANTAFAIGKNGIFGEAKAAWRDGATGILDTLAAAGGSTDAMDVDGAAAPLSAAAVRLVALAASAAAAGLVAPRGGEACGGDYGATRKALRKYCTAALDSPARDSVLAHVDAALADRGASGLAAATRIAANAAPRVGLDLLLAAAIYAPPPPEMRFRCDMRSHTPGVDGWLDWRAIDDLYAVYAALRSHSTWSSLPAWVESSSTCRAFEAGGQQIFAGMRLKEITFPSSILRVFDQEEEECEGVKYRTYTIFCGSDYQFRVRGRAPVDKCACLVEAVKAYMASCATA